LEIFKKLKYIG